MYPGGGDVPWVYPGGGIIFLRHVCLSISPFSRPLRCAVSNHPYLLSHRGFPILFTGCFSRKGYGTSLTAVETMLKIMKKMAENASEDKFKRIRLGNAGFNSKVGGVNGGLEVRAEPSYVYPRSNPIRLRTRLRVCFGL